LLAADAGLLFIVWFFSKHQEKIVPALARETLLVRRQSISMCIHPLGDPNTCASNDHASNRSALCETLSIRYLAHRKAVRSFDRTAANGKNGKCHRQKCHDS